MLPHDPLRLKKVEHAADLLPGDARVGKNVTGPIPLQYALRLSRKHAHDVSERSIGGGCFDYRADALFQCLYGSSSPFSERVPSSS